MSNLITLVEIYEFEINLVMNIIGKFLSVDNTRNS